MIKTLVAVAASFVVLAPAALAADPGAALTADLQKLSADRGTMHTAVLSDINKATGDAKSNASSTVLRVALKKDIQGLLSDVASNHTVLQADRQQALADYEAAKTANEGGAKLASQYQQLLQLWQQDANDLIEDAQAAQQTIAALQSRLAATSKG